MSITVEMQEVQKNVVITTPPKKGIFSQWLEKNNSRIKEFKYSLKLFSKSYLTIIGLIIVLIFIFMMIFAPYIAPYRAEVWNWDQMKLPPNPQHIMGTDQNGGDVFSRIVWGSQLSLPIGFAVGYRP